MNLRLALFFFVAALGVASSFETRLSVFAFLLLVIAWAAQIRFEHSQKRWLRAALVVGSLAVSVGLYRFILIEALPGIIDARARASSSRAVSFLREILFAEDALRRYAFFDADGDHVGSSGRLGELTGSTAGPARTKISTPPLELRYAPHVQTRSGPALELEGYLILVCVPAAGGGFTAQPDEAVDEERAEREWIAYAWPARLDAPVQTSFFIDQHERILESTNQTTTGLRLLGQARVPSCDDALAEPTQVHYRPWKGKTARESLPGGKP